MCCRGVRLVGDSARYLFGLDLILCLLCEFVGSWRGVWVEFGASGLPEACLRCENTEVVG